MGFRDRNHFRRREREERTEDVRQNKRREKISDDERIRRHNEMTPWQKFRNRKSPEARRARIAEKKLIAQEETLNTKIHNQKNSKKPRKGGLFGGGQQQKSSGGRRSSGRRATRGRGFEDNIPSQGSVYDNSMVGSGLGDMFGNTTSVTSPSGKRSKKDSGIDGLTSLFG